MTKIENSKAEACKCADCSCKTCNCATQPQKCAPSCGCKSR
ncbi:MAG: hypothetical protein U1E93_09365 [Alphaproteobacteria bacterium]